MRQFCKAAVLASAIAGAAPASAQLSTVTYQSAWQFNAAPATPGLLQFDQSLGQLQSVTLSASILDGRLYEYAYGYDWRGVYRTGFTFAITQDPYLTFNGVRLALDTTPDATSLQCNGLCVFQYGGSGTTSVDSNAFGSFIGVGSLRLGGSLPGVLVTADPSPYITDHFLQNAGMDLRLSVTYNYLAAAVPENSTWALMIVGFGLVGGAMRRRNTQAVAI